MDRKKCIDAADSILKQSVPAAYEGVQRAYRELMKSDQENFLPLDGRIRHTLLLIRELVPDYREQFHGRNIEDDELDEFYAVYTTPVETPEDDAPEEADLGMQEEDDEQPPDSYYSEMDGWDDEGETEEPGTEPQTPTVPEAPQTQQTPPAANTEPRAPKQKPPEQKPQKPVPPAPTHPDIDPDSLDDLFGFD